MFVCLSHKFNVILLAIVKYRKACLQTDRAGLPDISESTLLYLVPSSAASPKNYKQYILCYISPPHMFPPPSLPP